MVWSGVGHRVTVVWSGVGHRITVVWSGVVAPVYSGVVQFPQPGYTTVVRLREPDYTTGNPAPVWEPGQVPRVWCGSRVRWCGPVWDTGLQCCGPVWDTGLQWCGPVWDTGLQWCGPVWDTGLHHGVVRLPHRSTPLNPAPTPDHTTVGAGSHSGPHHCGPVW